MHFKVLALLSTVMIITSCVSKNSHAISCSEQSLFTRGVKDGEIGVNHSDSIKKLCAEPSVKMALKNYLDGRNEGLKLFCSSTRAKNRASLNLGLEEDCKNFSAYTTWFDKSIESICTRELAIADSLNFKPSNTNCMTDNSYKKVFMSKINLLCTNKLAYEQGYSELELEPYCLKTSNKTSLLAQHRLGLEKKLNQKNSKLKIKASLLKSKIQVLKSVSPKSDKEKVANKTQTEKFTKELLKTLHAIEQNQNSIRM